MVAKIISGKSLIGALNYNEKKVSLGSAELIWQSGFHMDFHKMNFYDKLFRLQDLADQNEYAKTNTVHISLNFAVGEDLTLEVLNQIADKYMDKIGFGNQPYLVYKHHDAGHPHIHIVTTNIKPSGERISLHNLGKTKSEEARKIIEQQYGLIPASKEEIQKPEIPSIKKVVYGKVDTKRAISNVVRGVITSYKFTSLPELNAAMGYYNVVADRGSKESRMYAKNGLLYWALDREGKKVGIPIKASDIYGSPTLKNLEERFHANEPLRKAHKERLRNVIDRLLSIKASESGFRQALQQKGIDVIYRKNDQGRLYGITYVDHQSKVVFNGSDLGKAYSAAALSTWFVDPDTRRELQSRELSRPDTLSNAFIRQINSDSKSSDQQSLLGDLLKSEYQDEGIPDIQKRRPKKKRKNLTN